jgi:glutamate formiminotransferase/formiminotetrahydrofolate cyclodeaminase
MATCVALAEGLAERCAEELDLPVWLYGAAARQTWNRYLADIRRGEFEGLAGMLQRNPPDFGPVTPHPTAGALAVGAREVLIAWNVTLDSDDVTLARDIASKVREFQRVERDESGRVLRREGGGLAGVRALGWMSERDGAAQVTMNLTRWRQAPPHLVFDAVAQFARDAGANIRGSELVGMVPLEALLQAGRHFGETSLDDTKLVSRAVSALGLGEIVDFNPRERILEWVLEDRS